MSFLLGIHKAFSDLPNDIRLQSQPWVLIFTKPRLNPRSLESEVLAYRFSVHPQDRVRNCSALYKPKYDDDCAVTYPYWSMR